MDTCVFAFGPNEAYLYNSPSKWKWNRLPSAIAGLTPQFKDVTWIAFGEAPDSYFLSYVNKQDKNMMTYGPGVPAAFKKWLTNEETGKIQRNRYTRVTFGPNESFVAWDSTSIRWCNIPSSLEEVFHDWLSPAGWKSGPPRIVCLGENGSYLVVSEYGSWGYSNLPGEMKTELTSSGQDISKIQAATLSMFGPHYVAIMEPENFYCYDVPNAHLEENEEALCMITDSFLPPATAKQYETSRAEGRRIKQLEEAKKKRELAEKSRQEQIIKQTYQRWSKECDVYFASPELRHSFKPPPQLQISLQCREVSCVQRKQAEGSIGACKHDVEKLLRSSGTYSMDWLRKERLKWHPDRFGQRCDSIFREELTQKATQMYAIYEELISDEMEKQGSG